MTSSAPGSRFHKRWVLFLSVVLGPFGEVRSQPGREDPLPTGAPLAPAARPNSGSEAACSARFRICVHAAHGVESSLTLAALDALELAYERLVVVLGLPAPLPDGGLGGSDALDAYLSPEGPEGEPVRVDYDPPLLGGFDRAAGFCSMAAQRGALLERAATLCVGEAIALRLDPGETPHVRRAFATALWWMTGAPTVLDYEAVAETQARPELAIARRDRDVTSEGAAMLFEYLEHTRGESEPGTLAAALLSASGQKTSPGASNFENEPDTIDVLRHTLDERRARLLSLFRDFAVSRTFVGARDDGLHLPSLGWTGNFGVAPFDWVIPLSSLPRRVLLSRPVEPSGAALLWLELDQPLPKGKTLGFQAVWEAPVAFGWTLVRIASDGSELSRVDVPFQERATEVEARLTELDGARAVAVIGTYLDEVSLAHPFDPDVTPFEPHSATVYLVLL